MPNFGSTYKRSKVGGMLNITHVKFEKGPSTKKNFMEEILNLGAKISIFFFGGGGGRSVLKSVLYEND